MKNRAKCKLCKSIIESFHPTDHVSCKCGAIIVDGGDAMICYADDWGNFLRVDDLGNEIVVKVTSSKGFDLPGAELKEITEQESNKPSKKELIGMLKEMINNFETLPQSAMLAPVNHYDLCSALILISSILQHNTLNED